MTKVATILRSGQVSVPYESSVHAIVVFYLLYPVRFLVMHLREHLVYLWLDWYLPAIHHAGKRVLRTMMDLSSSMDCSASLLSTSIITATTDRYRRNLQRNVLQDKSVEDLLHKFSLNITNFYCYWYTKSSVTLARSQSTSGSDPDFWHIGTSSKPWYGLQLFPPNLFNVPRGLNIYPDHPLQKRSSP